VITTVTVALLAAAPPPQISAGDDNACAAFDGKLFCWGENNDGEMGDGSTGPPRSRAGRVPGLSDVVHAHVGDDIVCAVRATGAVLCWGEAFVEGQPAVHKPTAIEGITDAIAVQAIDRSACSVHKDGKVRCWGRGQAPGTIPNINDAVQLAARRGLGCVRHRDGGVSCWDFERESTAALRPTRKAWLKKTSWIAVTNGGLCGVTNGHTVCGLALQAVERPSVSALKDIVRVAREDAAMCVLRKTGRVTCQTGRAVLAEVPGLTGIVDVSVGEGFACAIDAKHRAWCWGKGDVGQLGHGRIGESITPVRVVGW